MRYWQLKPGDVLIRNKRPLWVVIECDPNANRFRWMPLWGEKAGCLSDPNMELIDMWNEYIDDSYDEVLRGSECVSLREIASDPNVVRFAS